jgi:hypothetical protein
MESRTSRKVIRYVRVSGRSATETYSKEKEERRRG